MNRYLNIFLAAVFCSTYAFSQATNVVGTGVENIGWTNVQFSGSGNYPSNYAANVDDIASLDVSGSSTFNGGAGGSVTVSDSSANENGGTGLRLTNVVSAVITDSVLRGGHGGTIVANNTTNATSPFAAAKAGHGIELNGTGDLELGAGVVAVGGDGGTINNNMGRARAFGGDGAVNYVTDADASVATITVSGGSYQGGDGGSAVFNSDGRDLSRPDYSDDVYFDNLEGARGGNGLRVSSEYNWLAGSRSGSVTINDGVFAGGDGGTAQNPGTSGADASGGHGVLANHTDIFIHGGTFSGGTGGTGNGIKSADGYSIRTRDANLTVTGGSFVGNGQSLLFETHYLDSTATISDGTFGDMIFMTVFNEEGPGTTQTGTINISGGSFGNLISLSDATTDISITNATLGDIYFSGAGAQFTVPGLGTHNIAIDSAVISSGNVLMDEGTVNVSQWGDAHFMDTTISAGTMNFNTQQFNLLDGMTMTLGATSAKANFSGGLQTAAGSVINTPYIAGSSAAYPITASGTGSINLAKGTEWFIGASASSIPVGQTINMARSSGTGLISTNNFSAEDVRYAGVGAAGWLGGINTISLSPDQKILKAVYGDSSINIVLGVAGDTSTEYARAVNEWSGLVGSSGPAYDGLKPLANTTQEGGVLMTNTLLRTTEMASALVGLQSIFSDQIKDRTRSYLRDQQVGYPAASTPAGSAGWEAMRQFSDRMEDSFGYDEVMAPIDAAVPDVSYDQVKGAVDAAVPDVKVEPITLPAAYQTWGRGYGSYIEQDSSDDFAGYDTTIGGGMLGIDKQINNVLIGIAGGYARTVVDGDYDKDGSSDTGHAGVYFSAHGEHAFLDANANYAYNDVQTEYNTLDSKGDYAAHTVGLYLGGGYAFSIAKYILLTPEASILSTYYKRDAYTETSDLYPSMRWDSYDQWAYLGTVGATLGMIHQIDIMDGEIAVYPEFRLHFLHDFNNQFDDETYTLAAGQDTISAALQAREEDLFKVGAGVRLTKWSSNTTEIGIDVDGIFADNYNAYIVSGKILHRF